MRTVSSPLVRNIARAEGVDISQVSGHRDPRARDQGRHPRLPRAAQERHVAARRSAAPAPPPAAAARVDTGFHVPAYVAGENVVIEPMSKIRQITAAHMRYSKDTSAHVTTVFHMDFTKVHAARERAKSKFLAANGTKLTYMPFIFRAVCEGIKSNPKLNAADRRHQRGVQEGRQPRHGGGARLGAAGAGDQARRRDEPGRAGAAPPTTSPTARGARSSSRTRSRAARSRSPTPASSARCSARRSSTSRRSRSSASARSRSGRWS